MRVLVASPVRNRAWILAEYLACIEDLDSEGVELDQYYIDNGSEDNSGEILWEHSQDYDEGRFIVGCMELEEEEYDRNKPTPESLQRMAKLRDKLRTLALAGGYDYLLSIDSDILVPSDLLQRLLAHKLDIVAATISNPSYPRFYAVNAHRYIPPTGGPLQNSHRWSPHRYSGKVPPPTLVDSTGAVVLLSKKALMSGSYSYQDEAFGDKVLPEDFRFSLSTKLFNIKSYLDETLLCWHCWNQGMLDEYNECIAKGLSSDQAIADLTAYRSPTILQ